MINVGARQFRNHFGYYMERARQGAEVLVSRRGRPFVRLLGTGESVVGEMGEAEPTIR